MRFFNRSARIDAEKFAEARAMLDDGLDLDFVLGVYRADAAWLEPALRASRRLQAAFAAEEPSLYFEASLKTRFLQAARRKQQVAIAGPISPLRTGFAAGGVLAATALMGVVTFGFVTADNAVPGDWNYTFKLANERVEYALARGNDRVNVQLHQAEARVYEIQQLAEKGNVSAENLARLEAETARLKAEIARNQTQLDEVQKARIKVFSETVPLVLNDVKTRQSELAPVADSALSTVNDTVAAAGIGVISTPVAATGTPTAAATPTATASPTETPTPTATATPTATSTPEPTATPTATAEPSATASPQPSAEPTAPASSTPVTSATQQQNAATPTP